MTKSKCDQLLIACIQKDWSLTKQEREHLETRKRSLNQKFSFTKRNLSKLRRLNDVLKQKEMEINVHANLIRSIQLQWIENKLIADYEIDFKLSLWSNVFDKLHPACEGNPFYKDRILMTFGHKDIEADTAIMKDNWNEFLHYPGHPLANEFHCYTLHHIYDHTYLSWSDIVSIDDVWIEIIVTNQFLIKIPGNKNK